MIVTKYWFRPGKRKYSRGNIQEEIFKRKYSKGILCFDRESLLMGDTVINY